MALYIVGSLISWTSNVDRWSIQPTTNIAWFDANFYHKLISVIFLKKNKISLLYNSFICPPSHFLNFSVQTTTKSGTSVRVRVSSTAITKLTWQGHCQAKLQRGYREFQHPAGIEPISSISIRLAWTTKPWVCIDLLKSRYPIERKNRIWIVIFRNSDSSVNWFFACKIVILGP